MSQINCNTSTVDYYICNHLNQSFHFLEKILDASCGPVYCVQKRYPINENYNNNSNNSNNNSNNNDSNSNYSNNSNNDNDSNTNDNHNNNTMRIHSKKRTRHESEMATKFALKIFNCSNSRNKKQVRKIMKSEIDRNRKLQQMIEGTKKQKSERAQESGDSNAFALDSSQFVYMVEENFNESFQCGYILSEFIDGQDLFVTIQNYYYNTGDTIKTTISHQKAFYITNAMIEILTALHAKQIYHGDISCENWMWTDETQQLKIIDYASLVFEGEKSNDNIFKMCYAPPEFTRYNSLETATYDMYALGVCIFTLWTGYPPFRGIANYCSRSSRATLVSLNEEKKTEVQWLDSVYKYLMGVTPSIHPTVPTIPEGVKIVILKLLHPHVKHRWNAEKLQKYWNKYYTQLKTEMKTKS